MKTNSCTQKVYKTTYAVAASYIQGGLILCNNIAYIDEDLTANTIGYLPEDDDNEYQDIPEIYQYYLTACDEDQCKWLNEHFGLMFAYSEMLELWVLLVDHCGTAWNFVEVDTDLHNAAAPIETKRIN